MDHLRPHPSAPVASPLRDVQAERPAVALAIDSVGVVDTVVGLVLDVGDGVPAPTTARLDLRSALGHEQRGVHMSRFHESLAAATPADPLTPVRPDALVRTLAADVAGAQAADCAAVSLTATVSLPDSPAPDSGIAAHVPVDVAARCSHDAGTGTSTTTIGISVAGINACPCAQDLVRESAAAQLDAAGFSVEQAQLALACVPAATHNQRGIMSIEITAADDPATAIGRGTDGRGDVGRRTDGHAVAVRDLPTVVELTDLARACMGARTHELLKRGDELAVVLAAHADPHFVEDCVRAALLALARRPDLLDADVVCVHQRNMESIHAHDVTAERTATIGELRTELGARLET